MPSIQAIHTLKIPSGDQPSKGTLVLIFREIGYPSCQKRAGEAMRRLEQAAMRYTFVITGGAMRKYQDRIVRDPQICGGEPVIKGTRVTVRTILASLADGDRAEDILKDFPTLNEEDVRAVIAFAAASAEEDLPPVPLPRAS
jgi:uncharacterized protein (DUF433 family)